MRASKPVRVGIIGCGYVSEWAHIPALKRIKNAELTAVCDVSEELARGVAQRFHIPRYYTEPSKMLENEPLDIVHMCTPPKTHASLSIQAMEAGCHVLVEKPMALSVKDADMMIRASKDVGVKLGVVHNMPLHPIVTRARAMVAEGGIGELTGIDLKYSLHQYGRMVTDRDHWCHELPGGIFGNKLPHPISLARAFLGNLETVAVYAAKIGDYDWIATDELRVILKSEKGLGMITSSLNWPIDMAMLDIFGTKKNIHIYFNNAVMNTYGSTRYGRLSRGLENVRQSSHTLTSTASTALSIALGRHHYGHYAVIRGFIECVRDGTEPPVTAEDGRDVVRLYEDIVYQM